MKKIIITVVCLFAGMVFTHGAFAQEKLESWKELKAFHEVMSQTFHPMEKGDLKPIKARISEMSSKAKVLATSKIPAEYSNQMVKDASAKLMVETEMLNQRISNNASDEEIKKSLTALHETFHMIVERCQQPEKGHKQTN